jgi:hypothetical protein
MDFEERRALALAILNQGGRLTRKAGSFCGQVAVDPMPLTDAQIEWLEALAERAGLTPEISQ